MKIKKIKLIKLKLKLKKIIFVISAKKEYLIHQMFQIKKVKIKIQLKKIKNKCYKKKNLINKFLLSKYIFIFLN